MRDKFIWKGYEWTPTDRGIIYKPDRDYCYYDPDAVMITKGGDLELKIHKNPCYINTSEGLKEYNMKTIDYGMGLVSCTEHFRYGYFEIDCKLPMGYGVWPAFWMWCWESYPPEIDVLEGYSRHLGYKTFNPFRPYRIQSNIHFSHDGVKHLGAKNHFFGYKNPSKHFMKYGVYWSPTAIVFYYNGKAVRKVTNEIILNDLRGKTMMVVINNHPLPEYEGDKSVFIIRDFKYQSYKFKK